MRISSKQILDRVGQVKYAYFAINPADGEPLIVLLTEEFALDEKRFNGPEEVRLDGQNRLNFHGTGNIPKDLEKVEVSFDTPFIFLKRPGTPAITQQYKNELVQRT